MRIRKYIKKKVKSKYKLYKQEKGLAKKANREMRREVLKVKLKTRKEQAIKLAREREIIKSQRKIKLLRRPQTRGFASFWAKPMKFPKVKKKKKKKRKRK